MAGSLDSIAAFQSRCGEIGMSQADRDNLANAGYDTVAGFAFSCNYVPGAPDDTAFVAMVNTVNQGVDANSKLLAAMRRLFFECYSLAAHIERGLTYAWNPFMMGWSNASLQIMGWMNWRDKMSFRTTAHMHHDVAVPAAGQRAVCRNKDRIAAFLCLEDSARMLMACPVTASTLRDESKPWFHFRDFRDYDSEGEFDPATHPEYYEQQYPAWWETVGMAVAYGEHVDRFAGDAGDGGDDAAWS